MAIDFIITWVDGADEEWLTRKNKHSVDFIEGDSENRYRDWGLLKYWFRSVSINAPWVRKVFFVTEGHLPSWLNVDNPKLEIVRHSDYIPEDYLPTFSSHPIELNFHRIEDLSENFVYFNDDMFIIEKIDEDCFFSEGIPCDMAIETPVTQWGDQMFGRIISNNMHLINREFDKRKVIYDNLTKWVNLKYKGNLYRTISHLPWRGFTGLDYQHLPQPFLKRSFVEVWDRFYKEMNQTSLSKFRNGCDVNQYLIKNWQLCSGNFHPYNTLSLGNNISVNIDNIDEVCSFIDTGKKSIICLNDTVDSDLEYITSKLDAVFSERFPNKCEFENN
ncbi:Capsular polysaccharide phosphotransferase SacB [Vibrio campbellii]|uniref:Stealth CR1 domain-containing protein n=1 Tax=Vibrio campbellii TaxID=680 RepID=UPI0005314C44|nr:Stealth CR1 domain-containing protein [Vibrio campbellii]KGR36766.1 Capsular polysaccharide phosphotransferase SacB [Vibrio campbellii]